MEGGDQVRSEQFQEEAVVVVEVGPGVSEAQQSEGPTGASPGPQRHHLVLDPLAGLTLDVQRLLMPLALADDL